ncbi:microfibril-associated glycoprotein 4-like [Mytilus californianus]|uniref:microfibril-associated glycoprotein 4-like n=1 Tax=Mytilus californianus TaxID=6549 RepID=UPI0022475DA1|nr:microfibril-associated glycoprotein 4-like [Mytilus californianus]
MGLPRECADISGQHPDGEYKIYPDGISAVSVFCDMHTEQGKWTVIQRRINGSVDFERNWETYKEGFGNINGEYWLGNDVIHEITIHTRHELRIDMYDFEGHTKYAKYSMFMVGDEKGEYEMSVFGYSGNAGDSMAYHSGKLFSTFDRDNDMDTRKCAKLYHGGWWYDHCHDANLNGRYLSGSSPYGKGINWPAWHGLYYSLKSVKMMIRTLN